MKTLKGLALQDIITEVHSFIQRCGTANADKLLPHSSRIEFPAKVRIYLLEKIGEIEYVNETSRPVVVFY